MYPSSLSQSSVTVSVEQYFDINLYVSRYTICRGFGEGQNCQEVIQSTNTKQFRFYVFRFTRFPFPSTLFQTSLFPQKRVHLSLSCTN